MRKYYIYAITLIILSLTIWAGYYVYMEYRPTQYKYGTFVEVEKDFGKCIKELAA